MKQAFTRYVIQRENGKFYWQGQGRISSYHGYSDNLGQATLYKIKTHAKLIANLESNVTKVEVKEVKVTIEIE